MTVCHDDVVLLSSLVKEENRLSPAGREPIEEIRKHEDRASASAAALRVSDGIVVVCSPLQPPLPSRQVRVELSVFTSATRLFLPLPFHPLARSMLHELACAARRVAELRGDFQSGRSNVESSGK